MKCPVMSYEMSAGKGALGHVVEERGCELYLHLETTCHGEG